jgi:hypothetical protein
MQALGVWLVLAEKNEKWMEPSLRAGVDLPLNW